MNPSTALARQVVAALLAGGVREAVLCPGSRSAPLAYALHAAEAAGALRLHVRHDERAAAFTALGMGRAGAGPAVVVTTSGTAVANLLPATLEAHHGGVPLLLLTGDRPARLRGTWANQTSDLQPSLLGGAVRTAVELPGPAGEPADARQVVVEAVAAARGTGAGRPGPVHLDIGLDDPLVPEDDAPWGRSSAVPAAPPARPESPAGERLTLARGPATVVVAGDGAGPGARALAARTGWPLLAEPTSGARTRGDGDEPVGAYRLVLAAPGLGDRVERVVVMGRPTLSRPVTRLLARADVTVVQVVRHPDEPGPDRPVTRTDAVPQVAGASGAGERDWLAAWQQAGRAGAAALDAVLDAEAAAGRLTGPLVAREVAAATTPGRPLVVAASNPVRDLDLAAHAWPARTRVLANRGVAGIDGTLSTAAGVALATGAARVLLGDLAALHDANGLLVGPGEPEPALQVVVLDDDGGGIFGLLEHGEPGRAATLERLFATPHGADVAGLLGALGVPVTTAADLAGLRAELADPPPGRSAVRVPADRSGLRDLHARIAAAVAAAIAPAGG